MIPGTLAANHTFVYEAFRPCTLLAVSVSNSSANAGKIDIGPSTDPDGYLDDEAFGTSNTPAIYDLDDFDGAELSNPGHEYPRIEAEDIVHIVVTDHNSHMADVAVVLTLADG